MKNNNKQWVVCIILGLFFFVPGLILSILHPELVFSFFLLLFGLVIFIVGLAQRNKIQKAEEVVKAIEEGKITLPARQDIYINYKPLDQQMIFRYKFENNQAITVLCDLIIRTTLNFNQQSNTNVSTERVADLLFNRYFRDLKSLTIEQLNNCHFGFIGYITICCILASDDNYTHFRNNNEFWEKYELIIDGFSPIDLKIDFLTIMDYCYIDLHLEKLEKCDFDNLSNELEGAIDPEELFDMAIQCFKQKYKLINDDFIKIRNKG